MFKDFRPHAEQALRGNPKNPPGSQMSRPLYSLAQIGPATLMSAM